MILDQSKLVYVIFTNKYRLCSALFDLIIFDRSSLSVTTLDLVIFDRPSFDQYYATRMGLHCFI